MVGPSYQVFSIKLPSSSSSSPLSSMKLKTLIETLILSHFCRIVRALSKGKSILIQALKYPSKKNNKKNKNKIFFGSFRLHYNWCSSSSHVMPVPAPVLDRHLYYDSTWNSVISSTDKLENCPESQLSGYLHWLEEKVHDQNSSAAAAAAEPDYNEIDRLADIFIANCHEKFILEKQESYRIFQEMLARSM